MDHSPLARLPPELRNNIYELVFKQATPITIVHPYRYQTGDGPGKGLALTKTCRQIHAESSQLFYSCNTFVLIARPRGGEAYECLNSWVSRIGQANASAMRKLHIDVCEVGETLHKMRSILSVVREVQMKRELMAECWFELLFRVRQVQVGEPFSLVWDPRDASSLKESRQQCVARINAWQNSLKGVGTWYQQGMAFDMARSFRATLKWV